MYLCILSYVRQATEQAVFTKPVTNTANRRYRGTSGLDSPLEASR